MDAVAPSDTVDVSVIVVNYNTRHLLDEMMACLNAAAQGLTLQVIIVDNASADGSAEYIRATFPQCQLIVNERNVGFGRANNQAVPFLTGRFVLLLNTDAFMSPGALQASLQCMQRHPRCGIVGLKLVGRDGELQPSCRYFPTPWNVFLNRTGLHRLFKSTRLVDDIGWGHDADRACDWVPGCYYLMPRELVTQVGLFDPRFFLYYEEVDHCRRAKAAGWEVMFCGDATVVHIGGESAKTTSTISEVSRQIPALQIESELLFFRKHHHLLGVCLHILFTLITMVASIRKLLFTQKSTSTPQRIFQDFQLLIEYTRKTRIGLHNTR